MGRRGEIEPTVPASAESVPPGADLAEGMMLGRYRLVTRLGAGAMGVVWSAEDPQLERMVAIKVVHPMLARSPDASERLLREARAMAKLSHRSVVTVHDAGEVDGRLFLAMELVPGTTLGQMLRARSPAQVNDWQRWLIMMIEAGQGLSAAHGKGVLHRDFKPDNVLVDSGGRVCVADFGLATLGHINDAGASQPMDLRNMDLTSTGALIGTPLYMSAEQLRGAPIDARADQFAFCVALYEAMYDAKPFPVAAEGIDAIVELIEKIERGKVAPPPGTTVPDSVRRAVLRGLAAKPDDRWPSLHELLVELSRAAGLSTQRDSLPRPEKHRRVWPALAIGGVLVAGALAAFALTHRGSPVAAKHDPDKLFGVATHSVIALTPDGTRMVVGNDTLEVHSLDTKKTWTTQVLEHVEVAYAEIDDKEVRFSTRGHLQGPGHWAYATTGEVHFDPVLDGVWLGRTVAGDVVVNDHELKIVASGRIVRQRATPSRIDVVAISPDRRRVAYIAASRFAGEIMVWDVDADTTFGSTRLDSPTSLDWVDDTTLAYATGVYAKPTIWRVKLAGGTFGPSEPMFTQPFGWYGYLRVFRSPEAPVYYAIDMRPSARTRLIDRSATGGTIHDFDATTTTVALAWLDAQMFLAWTRDTGAVEKRTTSRHESRTNIVIANEPANATRAGDTLIASVRTAKGREVDAYSIEHTPPSENGKPSIPLWSHPDLMVARCAGDRQAPCFAVIARDDFEQVVSLDPATGALGNEILYTGSIEDIAVTSTGDIIHVADRAHGIAHIDLHGKVLGAIARTEKLWTRSLACQTNGTILVGGTAYGNLYQVGALTGASYEMLTETENDILSLVRPSDDGDQVLFLARTFSPEVLRLQ